jgi:membrane protease YdiL (CAAX protease family)
MVTVPVVLLVVAGALASAAAWLLIRTGRVSIWTGSASVNGVLALISLLTERVNGPGDLDVWPAVLVGVGAGVALYLATAAFMAFAGGWAPLREGTEEVYGRREGMSTPGVVGLAAGVVAPAEEVFWRGLVQGVLAAATTPLLGAVLGWAGYVAVNAVSGSIPIVLGAAVGGAVWAALAWATGGVLASVACHAVWTALMIVRPPVPAEAR